MDKLQAMTTFARVVETQSFSKAAQTLSMPRSAGAAIKTFVDWIIRIFPQSGVNPDDRSR
jgi:DNA-binding transcriptional LysR family regulator